MKEKNIHKETSTDETNLVDSFNLDYDYVSEYGDGDIPEIDKPQNKKSKSSQAK